MLVFNLSNKKFLSEKLKVKLNLSAYCNSGKALLFVKGCASKTNIIPEKTAFLRFDRNVKWVGLALAQPEFGSSVNTIPTRGGRL